MLGFAILLGFNFLGVALHIIFDIPIPGNVLGLILFTIALFTRIIKLEWVEKPAQFLLKHMMLFFAPIIVGVIAFFPMIGQQWLSILVSLIVSTIVVLGITGWVTKLLSGKEQANESR